MPLPTPAIPSATPRWRLTDLSPGHADMLAEVLAGLGRRPKRLSSKYFYDARGSALFEEITHLPEYYLTRVELALLHHSMKEIAAQVGPRAHVVELGTGSGKKTRVLLEGLDSPVAYTAVEISRGALVDAAGALAREFPAIGMMMPGMNGLQVLAALRADPALRTTPCVAISANAMPEEIDAAMRAGFDGYLVKPLAIDVLLREIDRRLAPRTAAPARPG